MFAAWIRNNPYHREIKDWITFEALTEYRGGGFDKSSGTYTVPEDGIYIFGLQAKSGSKLVKTQINFLKNNAVEFLRWHQKNDNLFGFYFS